MKHAKILIADDEAAITTGLSAILEDAGYDVEVVADGQKALDKLAAERVRRRARRSQDAQARRARRC